MLQLAVPDQAYATFKIALGGILYDCQFYFNERDQRWRLSLYVDGDAVITGIKILENQSLLDQFILQDFRHGDITCLRLENDGEPVQFENLGIDKPYTLVYLTNQEIEEFRDG